MAVRLIGDKAMNTVISHLPGVKSSVVAKATQIEGRAETLRAMHYYEGEASISLTTGDTDAFVNLDDPAAFFIEMGHVVGGKYAEVATEKYVEGLKILHRAAGLM